jgi:hypothetical protein
LKKVIRSLGRLAAHISTRSFYLASTRVSAVALIAWAFVTDVQVPAFPEAILLLILFVLSVSGILLLAASVREFVREVRKHSRTPSNQSRGEGRIAA